MKIGVRAHDLGCLPATDLADIVASHGLECVQLTPHEALRGISVREPGHLPRELAKAVGEAFLSRRVPIAVLSCYINLVDPRSEVLTSELKVFCEYLDRVRDFGCSIVATETGSLHADGSEHPGNHDEKTFQQLIRTLATLVERAEQKGVTVAVEGVAKFVISTPAKIRRMLDTIASPNLGVILDPVNLLTEKNFTGQRQLIRDSFELFGDRIVAIHAKDLKSGSGGTLSSAPLGRGEVDYPSLLKELRTSGLDVPFIIEEATPATIDQGVRFLRETCARISTP